MYNIICLTTSIICLLVRTINLARSSAVEKEIVYWSSYTGNASLWYWLLSNFVWIIVYEQYSCKFHCHSSYHIGHYWQENLNICYRCSNGITLLFPVIHRCHFPDKFCRIIPVYYDRDVCGRTALHSVMRSPSVSKLESAI